MSSYEKGKRTGEAGVKFQVSLLTVALLNAYKDLEGWRLSTENIKAGKFDDLVLEYSEGTFLLQAKHRDNIGEKISHESLTTDNSKKDDFSLPKYFLSYEMIKKDFKNIKNIIVCTNIDIDVNINVDSDSLKQKEAEKAKEQQETKVRQKERQGKEKQEGKEQEGKEKKDLQKKYVKDQSIGPKDILYCGEGKLYTFNEEILPDLITKSKNYLQNNLTKSEINESVITEENLRDFLGRLQFYCKYPSGKQLEKHGDELCKMKLPPDITFLDMYDKVKAWYEDYITETLSRSDFEALFKKP